MPAIKTGRIKTALRIRLIIGFSLFALLLLCLSGIVYVHGQSLAWLLIVGPATAILGLVTISAVSRTLDKAVSALMAFTASIAAGSFKSRLPLDPHDEAFKSLHGLLNRMADNLQAAKESSDARELELKRLNRALRLKAVVHEISMHATSELELLQSFCRRIIESGGYHWVRISEVDEKNDPGSIVAQAGEETVLNGSAPVLTFSIRHGKDILGLLTLQAKSSEVVDAEEVNLLQELLSDLASYIIKQRNLAEQQRIESELKYQAHFDSLTGLPNRMSMEHRLRQSLAEAQRHHNKIAILVIDLDRFGEVNALFGHGVGDQVLITIAERLSGTLRKADAISRFGSDSFAILLTDVGIETYATLVANKIMGLITEPLYEGGHEIRPAASIGISIFPDDGQAVETLLGNADMAMQNAKSSGGNTLRFFSSEMNAHMAARFQLEEDLRRALGCGELLMYFQPQVSLLDGRITGAEALIRWRHPVRGLVTPADFIPFAEESGLIHSLGDWILDHVCRQIRHWLDVGIAMPTVAVNLSARQFRQENLVDLVKQALSENDLEPKYLELEITESAVMLNMEAAIRTMQELKALGVKLSLDDFGTGYSSLSYLKRFPIDHLKIDQSFVKDIISDPDDAAICKAVIDLAHNLELTVIAEGVETEAQMNYLRRHHCDEIQGFYFSKPAPAPEFAQMLVAEQALVIPEDSEAQTLLIVDDEESILKSLVRLFRRDGYAILSASSASQALELLAKHPVQVIISDQRMPGMSGIEFFSRVRELHPNTIRIILTGYADLESVIKAINQGAVYQFYTKPWKDEVLRKTIREAFRQVASISEHEPSV